MLIRPGTLELLDQAMAMGADVVGGLDPCTLDRDPKGHLDAIFGLAETYGRPLDIHLHERGEVGAFSMELIIERTRALGMKGKVTVSHAFCLGTAPELVDPVILQLAELDIAIMTTAPARNTAPAVKKLLDAGIRVCSGSDGIRDTWGPYGNADMVERAMFIGLRNNFRRDDEVELGLHVCTTGGAQVMEIADYGLAEGKIADLVIMPGQSLTDIVVTRSPKRRVIKRGKIVARDGVSVRTAP
jgi:cytosine deaminase